MINKTLTVRVIRRCILPIGNKAVVREAGNGFYLILKAQTRQGKLESTEPMTLWLQTGDFEICQPSKSPKSQTV